MEELPQLITSMIIFFRFLSQIYRIIAILAKNLKEVAMTFSRDIESLSLPFVAGIAAGAVLITVCRPALLYPAAGMALPLLAGCLLLALRLRTRFSLLPLLLMTGLFCSLSWQLGTFGTVSEGPACIGRAATALQTVVDAIPYPHARSGALIKALTTGDRSALDPALTAVFRRSGAAHLLALSGMHLGIIYLILTWLLKPMGNSPLARSLRYVLILLSSGAYVLVTGAGPSIVRAFLFIFLWETARLTGRETTPMKVWCGGILIQLALNPSVITSVGFQLSYLAMAGIFLLFPPLRDLYPSDGPVRDRFNLPRRIWEGAALALSCQAFTAPLSCRIFGTFPRFFLLTNLLAMPVSSLLMILSVTTVALSAAGCCPQILILADDAACQLLIQILEIIAGL